MSTSEKGMPSTLGVRRKNTATPSCLPWSHENAVSFTNHVGRVLMFCVGHSKYAIYFMWKYGKYIAQPASAASSFPSRNIIKLMLELLHGPIHVVR